MSVHDDSLSMRQMLDYAHKATRMVKGRCRHDLDSDEMLELALTRAIEVIGEAGRRVSIETRETQSHIPWSNIVGMRSRLIHGYDSVDLDLLWDTTEGDLPELIKALEKALGES